MSNEGCNKQEIKHVWGWTFSYLNQLKTETQSIYHSNENRYTVTETINSEKDYTSGKSLIWSMGSSEPQSSSPSLQPYSHLLPLHHGIRTPQEPSSFSQWEIGDEDWMTDHILGPFYRRRWEGYLERKQRLQSQKHWAEKRWADFTRITPLWL